MLELFGIGKNGVEWVNKRSRRKGKENNDTGGLDDSHLTLESVCVYNIQSATLPALFRCPKRA